MSSRVKVGVKVEFYEPEKGVVESFDYVDPPPVVPVKGDIVFVGGHRRYKVKSRHIEYTNPMTLVVTLYVERDPQ